MNSFCVVFNRFQTDKNRTKPKFQWFGFLSIWFGLVETKNRNQIDRFDLKPESFRDVFMTQKTIADYFWILNQLKAFYNQLKIFNSITIVIDMKRDLMQAINVIFSDTNYLLCLWHININVVVNCKRNFDINEAWNVFFSAWNRWYILIRKRNMKRIEKSFLVRMLHLISNWWSICKASTSTIFVSALSNALRIVFYILTLSQHLEMKAIMQCWSVV